MSGSVSFLTGMPTPGIAASYALPSWATTIASHLARIHRFWKSWRRTREITANLTHLGSFLAGYVLNQVIPNNQTLGTVALVAHLAKTALKYISQQRALAESLSKLKVIWQARNEYHEYSFVSLHRCMTLAPHLRIHWHVVINQKMALVADLAKAALEVLIELFFLTMRWMDLLEALALKEAPEDIRQDCILNCVQIIEELLTYREEIVAVLKALGSTHTIPKSVAKAAAVVVDTAVTCYQGCAYVGHGCAMTTRFMRRIFCSPLFCEPVDPFHSNKIHHGESSFAH